MPDIAKNDSQDFSAYDQMETEALEALLRRDVESDDAEMDIDAVCYVMNLLAKRKADSGASHRTAQEAYQEFLAHYDYYDDLTDAEYTEKETKSQAEKKPLLLHRIRKAACRAAVIGIALIALSATVVLSVDALRKPALKFVNTQFPNFSVLSAAEQPPEYHPHSDPEEAIQDAPVPEGFVLTHSTIDDSIINAYYYDKASNYIIIDIVCGTALVQYNSEGYESTSISINGQEALFLKKENEFKLIWLDDENNAIYMLGAQNLSKDTFFNIADYWLIQQISFPEA